MSVGIIQHSSPNSVINNEKYYSRNLKVIQHVLNNEDIFSQQEASAGYRKDFLGRRGSHVQEMGFLVDDRSVIGVSNLVVASDYKDANVPVAKFRQDKIGRAVRMNVVEESQREQKEKGREWKDRKIRRDANGPLNGLGGSKHRQREEINEKLATDNPSILFPFPIAPDFVGYLDFLCRVFAPDENNFLICRWYFYKNESLS